MIQRKSRFPAILMLLVLMAFGLSLIFVNRSDAGVDAGTLAKLQAAVEKSDASVTDWVNYGAALQKNKEYDRALTAYNHILNKVDSHRKEAREGGAQCYARLGQTDKLFSFMKDTIQVDPQLALHLFENDPDVLRFDADPKYKILRDEAYAGSMD